MRCGVASWWRTRGRSTASERGTAMAIATPVQTTRHRAATAIVDTDIHNELPSRAALVPYLPERWRRHHELVGTRTGKRGAGYPRSVTGNARTDSWPPSGLPPGADLPFMREQLLDPYGIEIGILNPFVPGG